MRKLLTLWIALAALTFAPLPSLNAGWLPLAKAGGGAAPTFAQLAAPASIAPGISTSLTFTSQPLGTAGAGRILIVSIGGSPQGIPLSGVTAGGNAMAQASGSDGFTSIWYVTSPGGTGNIVLSYSSTSPEFAISICELTGVTATPTSSPSAAIGFNGPTYAPAGLGPLTVPSTGFGIVATTYQDPGSPTMTGVAGLDAGPTTVALQTLRVTATHISATGTVTYTSYSGNIGYAAATWGP
jgi:hypothetical protein